YAFGAGQGCPLFVYLLVGTGVGAGVVVDGRLFAGAHGAAGEVGYLPFTQGPAATPASRAPDRRGMLEDAVIGDAAVAAAATHGMAGAAGPKEVFAAARGGDPRALAVVRAEAGRLAHAVAAVAAVLDPALVVIGGGIGDNADLLMDPLREALDDLTPL